MKKLILIFLATASLVFGAMYLVANAIGVAHTTVFNSNQVGTNPITGYYLETNGATSTWAAVSGGGGSITINGVSSTVFSLNSSTYLGITASGTAFTFTNLGVTSTAGNWAGTWQSVNSSTFYLASNPSGYLCKN